MPGFNQTGPVGQGPMTGRRQGRCNSSDTVKTDDRIKNTIISLVATLIIGIAGRVWSKLGEKRLKSDN